MSKMLEPSYATHTEWQTQIPVELAATRRENEAFRACYTELLNLHTELLSAMYEHDSVKIAAAYRKSLLNGGLLNREAIDQSMLKLTFIPPFTKQ